MSAVSRNHELVEAILAAHRYRANTSRFRARLIGAGLTKGTASKAVLVVSTLRQGLILPSDVTSLSTAYEVCKAIKQISNHDTSKPLPRAIERMVAS